jgi:hypothetical protein
MNKELLAPHPSFSSFKKNVWLSKSWSLRSCWMNSSRSARVLCIIPRTGVPAGAPQDSTAVVHRYIVCCMGRVSDGAGRGKGRGVISITAMYKAKHGARIQMITNSARNEKAKPLVVNLVLNPTWLFCKRVVILSTTTWDQKQLRM